MSEEAEERRNLPVGFFDSGLGGLSVLKAALQLLPDENYLYLGDSANAPYGSRPVEEIRAMTFTGIEKMRERNRGSGHTGARKIPGDAGDRH